MPQLFRTIRARLTLLALLALVPLLAMLAHAAVSVQRVREESEVTANLELARATAAAFSAFLRDVSRTALPLGEAIAGGQLSDAEASRLLRNAAEAYADAVRELSWASPGGEVLLSSNPRAVGVRVSDRDYHLRILAGDDESVSDLLRPRTGDEPSFVVARAVRGPSGRLLGTLLAVVAPERLAERTLTMRREGSAALALADRSGRLVFRSPPADVPPEGGDVALGGPVRRALRGEEAFGPFVGVHGDDRLGAAVPIAPFGWVAIASRDAAEVAGPVRREFARAGVLALLVATAALVASALVSRRIVGALRRLEDHADALGRGESSPPPSSSAPELQRLADAYGRMARRLSASRRALQGAFESAPAGILLVDGESLRARWANRAYLEQLDEPHRSGGIEGLEVESFLPGAGALGLADAFRRVAAGSLPSAESEQRFDRFGRGPAWWRWSIRPIPSADRPGGRDLLVLATDLTEQVLARRRVEEDRRRLEAVLDALPVGVLIADQTGRIVDANPAARAAWGGVLPESPARARGWWTDSGEPVRPGDWAISRALARGETSLGELIDVERPDGGRATLLNNAVPITGPGGGVIGAVAAMQDVSALRQAQRRERILLDAGAVLAETLDLDDAARRLARFAAPLVADLCAVDEVLPDGSLRPLALAHAGADGEAAARAALERHGALAHARRAIAERVTVHVPEVASGGGAPGAGADGLALRSWIVVPLVASGAVVGVLTLATAAPGRRLDEEDVRLAEELGWRAAQALDNARLFGEVRRAVHSRDEVLSVVSHDLRNPLGAVTLGARVVSELPDAPGSLERARRTSQRILAAGERMARLIGDLLDLAALETGKLAVARAACTPVDLLRDALEESRAAARQRGLELRCDAEPRLPRVACDRGRVLQVLGNLVSNAVKATERGHVRISAAGGRGEVVFSVEDTGPGIAPADQARLFERFSRGANAGYHGTGLGLAISRALVEAHGGRIWVESRPGEGATFRFTIPATAEEALPRAPGCGDHAGGAAGEGAAAFGR